MDYRAAYGSLALPSHVPHPLSLGLAPPTNLPLPTSNKHIYPSIGVPGLNPPPASPALAASTPVSSSSFAAVLRDLAKNAGEMDQRGMPVPAAGRLHGPPPPAPPGLSPSLRGPPGLPANLHGPVGLSPTLHGASRLSPALHGVPPSPGLKTSSLHKAASPSMEVTSSSSSSSLTSSLMDVRKGFSSSNISGPPFPRSPAAQTSTTSSSSPLTSTASTVDPASDSSFKPYKGGVQLPPSHPYLSLPPHPGYPHDPLMSLPPGLMSGLSLPYGLESDPLYLAHLHHYAVNLAGGNPGHPALPPLPGYPPQIPGLTADPAKSLRLGLHPAASGTPGGIPGMPEMARHKAKPLKSVSEKQRGKIAASSSVGSDVKRLTIDLDSSGDDIKVIEIDKPVTKSTAATTSASPTTASCSTPVQSTMSTASVTTTTTVTSTTCVTPALLTSTPLSSAPSVIKTEKSDTSAAAATASDSSLTPKCLFVRPFEDDYTPPVRPESRASVVSMPTTQPPEVSPRSAPTASLMSKLELVERKAEDQDSDYESMSSDSSVKRESLSDSLNKSDSFSIFPEEVAGQEVKEVDLKVEQIEEEEEVRELMEADVPEVEDSVEGLTLCPTSGLMLLPEHAEENEDDLQLPAAQPASRTRKEKLSYLGYLNLVTHHKKNDVEIAKLERRKRLLRERSPSPPPPAIPSSSGSRCASPCLPLPSLPPHQTRLPETHAKAMYLSAIGLCRNSDEQKIADEVTWSAVLDNRIRHRRDDTPINKYFKRLRQMSETFLRSVKRDADGTFLPPMAPPADSLTIPLSTALSFLNNDCMMFGAEEGITLHDSAFHQSATTDSSSSPAPAEPPKVLHLEDTKPPLPSVLLPSSSSLEDSKPLILSSSSSPGEDSKPVFGPPREDKKPLMVHPPLLSIKEEPPETSSASPPSKRRRLSRVGSTTPTSPPSLPWQQQGVGSTSPPSLPWQGVDAVIESYRKYQQECEVERAELIERSAALQAELASQRSQIDNLSTRLASLARLQQTLVSNHAIDQDTINTLVGSLRSMAQHTLKSSPTKSIQKSRQKLAVNVENSA